MENKNTVHKDGITFEVPRPAMTVSKAGVVNISTIYNRDIAVNSESMIDMLEDAIRQSKIKPICDMNGLFAGQVTITVEFLGDMMDSPTKEEFMAMSFEERLALKQKDENRYEQLVQEEADGTRKIEKGEKP